MQRDRSRQLAAAPLCGQVAELLSHAPCCLHYHRALAVTGLPPADVSDVEYFFCETRQWMKKVAARRLQEPVPVAQEWLREVWGLPFFQSWFRQR